MTQKALKFLDKKGINYKFHDYKVSGIDRATLQRWLKIIPLKLLLNSRSTTFRGFTEKEIATSPNTKVIIMGGKNTPGIFDTK